MVYTLQNSDHGSSIVVLTQRITSAELTGKLNERILTLTVRSVGAGAILTRFSRMRFRLRWYFFRVSRSQHAEQRTPPHRCIELGELISHVGISVARRRINEREATIISSAMSGLNSTVIRVSEPCA